MEVTFYNFSTTSNGLFIPILQMILIYRFHVT